MSGQPIQYTLTASAETVAGLADALKRLERLHAADHKGLIESRRSLVAQRDGLAGALKASQDANAELVEQLDESFPKSWAGFRAFIDEAYPDDIFPDDDRDLGPNMVVAARRIAELERQLESARRWAVHLEGENALQAHRLEQVRRVAEADRLGLRTYGITRDAIFAALSSTP